MAAHVPGPGATTRLPWWAVLLPVAVFAALLALLVSAGGTDGGPVGQRQPVTQFIVGVKDALLP